MSYEFRVHSEYLTTVYPREHQGEESPELIRQVRGGIESGCSVDIYLDGQKGKLIYYITAKRAEFDTRFNQFYVELTQREASPIELIDELVNRLSTLEAWEFDPDTAERLDFLETVVETAPTSFQDSGVTLDEEAAGRLEAIDRLVDVDTPELRFGMPSFEESLNALIHFGNQDAIVAICSEEGSTGLEDVDISLFYDEYTQFSGIDDVTVDCVELAQNQSHILQKEVDRLVDEYQATAEPEIVSSTVHTEDEVSTLDWRQVLEKSKTISRELVAWSFAILILFAGFLFLGSVAGGILFTVSRSSFFALPLVTNILFVAAAGMMTALLIGVWRPLRIVLHLLLVLWRAMIPPYQEADDSSETERTLFPNSTGRKTTTLKRAGQNAVYLSIGALILNLISVGIAQRYYPIKELAQATSGSLVYQTKSFSTLFPSQLTIVYVRDLKDVVFADPILLLLISLGPGILLIGTVWNLLYIIEPYLKNSFNNITEDLKAFLAVVSVTSVLLLMVVSIVLTAISV